MQEVHHGSTAIGITSGYLGYYNFLNIKASGATDSEVIENGLKYAQANGWTDPEISIKEGAKFLAQKYIKIGQDTLYLQKFDVDSSDNALYWHQYMQNVSAAVTEGANVKKAYEQLGLLNNSIDFVIPVYENMPRIPCNNPEEVIVIPDNSVSYRTHVENIGWQNYVINGDMSGTSGRSLRLEAIDINLEKAQYSGDVVYQTHVQNIGWQKEVQNGEVAGTSGKSLRLEAIKIKLTGEIANYYDIYYRVHCEELGWLDWAKNGEESGTQGYGYRLEGIEICLVKKGETVPGETQKAFARNYIKYQTHVENIGWQAQVPNGATSGTLGKSYRLEGVTIVLENEPYDGGIEYRTHIENIGWEKNYIKNGNMSGTSGKALRLEAIQIRLTGTMAQKYDIYYRVHAQNFGWLGWAKNDEKAGTAGYSYRLEALQICLVEKGGAAPGTTSNCFKSK